MTTRDECAEIRLLLAELALGSLTGPDRARALEHLFDCYGCRRELQALSELGDELLLLAPEAEPPIGFESRVLERLGAEEHRPRPRSRRRIAMALAAALAGLIGGVVVYLATGADRELADDYRDTLAVADGEYFGARPLLASDGSTAGHVFGYQGSPSWVFSIVEEASGAVYEIKVISNDGRRWTVGEMRTHRGEGIWARPLPVDLHDVRAIEFVERGGAETLVAHWSR